MKKKHLLFIALLVISLNSFSQNHELSIGLNTGYSFFSGESSSRTTFLNAAGTSDVYTNSPMGKKFTPSFGVSANYKFVFMRYFMVGAEIGYEDLRTKISLVGDNTGRTILNNHFLNGHPFIGLRLPLKNISFDVTFGLDFAKSLKCKEYGKYKDGSGHEAKFTNTRDSYIDSDVRPRIDLSVNYKKLVFFTGASFGSKNYYEDWMGGNPEAYLNTIRIGARYRIF